MVDSYVAQTIAFRRLRDLSARYLHAVPSFHEAKLEWSGTAPAKSVRLLRDGRGLHHNHENGVLTVDLPLDARTALVDVVKISM